MSVMTAAGTGLPTDRPLTVEDLGLLPDDGYKYELDDGVLVVTPPPALDHQWVLHQLQLALAAEYPADLVVLPGPALRSTNSSTAFLTWSSYGRTRSVSATSRSRGRHWIVTPSLDKPRLVVFELSQGRYEQVADVGGDEAIEAARPFPVRVVPSALVAGPWTS